MKKKNKEVKEEQEEKERQREKEGDEQQLKQNITDAETFNRIDW